MLKGGEKEKDMGKDDNGAPSTSLEIQGNINKQIKHQDAYIKKIGPWGSVRYSDINKEIKVTPHCLKSITIESGSAIYSFQFSYSDEHGMEHHSGLWGGLAPSHHTADGVFNTIQLGPEELLTGISGTTAGNVISSLTFITNTCQYGPFGVAEQIQFRSSPMSGSNRIVGFFARSGHVLDLLGFYVKIEREPMEKKDLITKVGLWGGESGSLHDPIVVPRRLASVVIFSGKVIHSLTFTYIDCDGHQHSSGPWGGLGTSKTGAFHAIMLGPTEIVKEVSGTVGLNTVTSLSFVTNIATYGPFGDGEGMPFRSPTQDNDSIVGFFAKAEQHINAIGFYLTSTEKQVSFVLTSPSTYFLTFRYFHSFH